MKNEQKYDVLCIGTALVDSILRGFDPTPVSATGYRAETGSLHVGGEAVNVSIAAARLGLTPADCVICEDTLSGIKSAAAAGAGRIVARGSDPTGGTGPKIYAVIDDFRDFFPKYLED